LPKESKPAQAVELPAHAQKSPRAPPEEHQHPEKAAPQSSAGLRQRDELPQQERPAVELLKKRQERAWAQERAPQPLQAAQRPA